MRGLISVMLGLGMTMAGRGQDVGMLPAAGPVVVQALGFANHAAAGRGEESEGSTGPLATLHVYANLMQIPTLILTEAHERLTKPIPEAKFRVSHDGGPPLQPTHVKLEGDDPIELAVLVDATKMKNPLLPGLVDAVAGLMPGALRVGDHVSVYAMDCSLIRTAFDLAVTGPGLRDAMARAMMPWQRRMETKGASPCGTPLPLWDAMSYVTRQLYTTNGRRVLLVVSDGADHGSQISEATLIKLEQRTTTTVFGLMTPEDMTAGKPALYSMSGIGLIAKAQADLPNPSDPFDIVVEGSGGVELAASRKTLGKVLQTFIEMLRERYIVEYPRGDSEVAGDHHFRVTVGRSDLYLRSAGIQVPLAHPETAGAVGVPR